MLKSSQFRGVFRAFFRAVCVSVIEERRTHRRTLLERRKLYSHDQLGWRDDPPPPTPNATCRFYGRKAKSCLKFANFGNPENFWIFLFLFETNTWYWNLKGRTSRGQYLQRKTPPRRPYSQCGHLDTWSWRSRPADTNAPYPVRTAIMPRIDEITDIEHQIIFFLIRSDFLCCAV